MVNHREPIVSSSTVESRGRRDRSRSTSQSSKRRTVLVPPPSELHRELVRDYTGSESEEERNQDTRSDRSGSSSSTHTVDESNIHLISGYLDQLVEDDRSYVDQKNKRDNSMPFTPPTTESAPAGVSHLRNRRSSSITTRPAGMIEDGTFVATSSAVTGGHSRKGSASSAINSGMVHDSRVDGSLQQTFGSESVGRQGRASNQKPRRGGSLNTTTSATPHHGQSHAHHISGQNDPIGSPSTLTDEPESFSSNYPASGIFSAGNAHHSTSRNAKHVKRPASPDYDSDGEYSENVSYAGSRPSSRRTSIQLHFQETPARSRRSSVRESTPGLGGNLANTSTSLPRRKGSISNNPITRQYSRGNGTASNTNSIPISRKGSINFVSTPPISSPTLRNAGPSSSSARRTGSRSRRSSVYEDDRDDTRIAWQWEQHPARRSTVVLGDSGAPKLGRRYTMSDRYPDERRGLDHDQEDEDDGLLATSDGERHADEGAYGKQSTRNTGSAILTSSVPGSSTFTVSRGGRGRSKSTSFSISTVKKNPSNFRRNLFISLLVILGLFLLGTVLVLSSIQKYLYIEDWAYLNELELGGYNDKTAGRIEEFQREGPAPVDEEGSGGRPDGHQSTVWGPEGKGTGGYWMRNDWDGKVAETDWNRLSNVTNLPGESIPRLIHQTWKSDVLPDKWRKVWQACREGMPDYEYMLWTDEVSRKFIVEKYPSFLATFDGYEYPIQRADAIRYFVLHYYGGVYMDLDIGCKRRLDPLLQGDWDVILPRTKPVGVSNDLMFSSKRSSFMEATIHGLIAFNHKYVTNYPTVMFSTGPMFLSVQYGLYTSAHPLTPSHPRADIRILPKPLYGKNAKPGEAPHAFFSHFYGSSWHADDADFIVFLGSSGKKLLWVGLVVFIAGGLRFLCSNNRTARSGRRSLRKFVMASTGYRSYHMVSILPTSESHDGSRTASPSVSSMDTDDSDGDDNTRILDIMKAIPAMLLPRRGSKRGRTHNDRSDGMVFFVPRVSSSAEGSGRHNRSASTGSIPATTGSNRYPSLGRNNISGSPYIGSSLQDNVVPEQTEDESDRAISPKLSVFKALNWMSSNPASPAPPPYDTLNNAADEVDGDVVDEKHAKLS